MLTTDHRCGGASMGGHVWLVTSEDAKCERGRKSKILSTTVGGESRELQLLGPFTTTVKGPNFTVKTF